MGLVISLILLVIAIRITREPHGGNHKTIDTIGVLEIIWLIRHRPELQSLLSQVDEPSVDKLRAAGMVDLRMAGEDVPMSGVGHH